LRDPLSFWSWFGKTAIYYVSLTRAWCHRETGDEAGFGVWIPLATSSFVDGKLYYDLEFHGPIEDMDIR